MMSPEPSPPPSLSPGTFAPPTARACCSVFVIHFVEGGSWFYVCMYDGSSTGYWEAFVAIYGVLWWVGRGRRMRSAINISASI